jgi:hypothetical protein
MLISMAFSVPVSKIINNKWLKTDMAAAIWTVEEVDQEIRMYVEYIKLKCKHKIVHSELMKSKKLVRDENVFWNLD